MKDYEDLIRELQITRDVWVNRLREADSQEKGLVARGVLHVLDNLIEKYENEYEEEYN